MGYTGQKWEINGMRSLLIPKSHCPSIIPHCTFSIAHSVRPHRLTVRTAGFHPVNRGSTPRGAATIYMKIKVDIPFSLIIFAFDPCLACLTNDPLWDCGAGSTGRSVPWRTVMRRAVSTAAATRTGRRRTTVRARTPRSRGTGRTRARTTRRRPSARASGRSPGSRPDTGGE